MCRHKARRVFNLLGGLKHLHDSFDPLHTEATLWITDVQLREGSVRKSDNERVGRQRTGSCCVPNLDLKSPLFPRWKVEEIPL